MTRVGVGCGAGVPEDGTACLTRIRHQLPAADADALVLRGRAPSRRFDVLSSTPASPSGPRDHAGRRLDALATKVGDGCGLIGVWESRIAKKIHASGWSHRTPVRAPFVNGRSFPGRRLTQPTGPPKLHRSCSDAIHPERRSSPPRPGSSPARRSGCARRRGRNR